MVHFLCPGPADYLYRTIFRHEYMQLVVLNKSDPQLNVYHKGMSTISKV